MLYHWNDPQSLLHHVEMLPGRKTPEAVIYAPKEADAGKLKALNQTLLARGYLTTADEIDGAPVLRVQQFGTREALFSTLSQAQAVQGTPVTQFTPLDKAAHKGTKQKVQENLMTGAGWLFLLGDALMVLSGIKRKDWAEAGTGVVWGSTGAVLAGFGKKDADTQMGILYRRLDEHLRKEGIELPRDERELVNALKRDNTLLKHTAEFLYNNAADFHHAMQAAGGTMLIKAGWNQRHSNPLKLAAGVSVTFGQSMGLMPEKEKPHTARPAAYAAANGNMPQSTDGQDKPLPPEPDHRGVIKRTVDWFNEKPLRYSGIFPALNNVFNTAGAVWWEKPLVAKKEVMLPARVKTLKQAEQKYNQRITHAGTPEEAARLLKTRDAVSARLGGLQKELADFEKSILKIGGRDIHAWEMNVATAGCYIAANLLYSMCSKNGSLDLEKMGELDDIYAVVANIAAAQPENFRQPFINRVATFLSQQKDMKGTADEIAGKIAKKAEAVQHSPWADRVRPANQSAPDMAQAGLGVA